MKKMICSLGCLSVCVLLQAVWSPCSAATANWRNIRVTPGKGFTDMYGVYHARPTTSSSSSISSSSSSSSVSSSTKSSGNQNAYQKALKSLEKEKARLVKMQLKAKTPADYRSISAQKKLVSAKQNLVNVLATKK